MKSYKQSFPYKSVLVTGGTGFVGSHLVETLIDKHIQVIVPYRSIDYASYFYKKGLEKKVTLVPCDIKSREQVLDVVGKYEVSFIYHLAAQPIVTTAFYNPVETLLTNIMGTVYLLEAVKALSHVKGIIVASSDKAYGMTKKEYTEDSPLRGLHPYDVSKSSCDLIAQTYATTYDLPVIVTRFGNIYGEGDRNMNRVIPGIIQSMLRKEEFIIRSDGTYVREYLYVKDVVNGYIALAEKFKDVVGEAFNFGTSYRRSVIELVHDVEKILNVKVPFKIANTAKKEIPLQALNWDKAKSKLLWKPTHTLSQVLPAIVEWYSHYNSYENFVTS